MQVLSLNHVGVHVKHVETSIRFYQEILNLKPIPRPAFDFPGAWFQLGPTQQLHLIGRHESQAYIPLRSNHFALQVASIKAAETDLRRKNIDFMGPKQRPDGIWQIFIQDPDGHFVELTELPEEL